MRYITNKAWLAIFKLSPPGGFYKVLKVEKFGKRYLLLEVKGDNDIDFGSTIKMYAVYDTKHFKLVHTGFYAQSIFKQNIINEVNEYIEEYEKQIFPSSSRKK